MFRARAARTSTSRARSLISFVAVAAVVAACVSGPSNGPATSAPGSSPTSSGTATASADPTGVATLTPDPGGTPTETATPPATDPATPPPTPAGACSGSDANREFFAQAAASMHWSVYCAVLPDGWFVENGTYRLASGGRLDITYRGPGGAHLSLAEGNLCEGSEVDECAPRDAVIGPAAFGDRQGELGQLATGLVLDVDRGANPSWRATGLGLTEEAFRGIGEALVLVRD
ncbi:MAG TPA: hypothetical protein VFX65_13030 [Candidatus Limnocylindrales bacterium]|nr:hypothetical protein [Candidatus Limnocylindrales bacterium]